MRKAGGRSNETALEAPLDPHGGCMLEMGSAETIGAKSAEATAKTLMVKKSMNESST